jgi:hypothetical protein
VYLFVHERADACLFFLRSQGFRATVLPGEEFYLLEHSV